ncbi:MAG: peptidyl-prolyl cis-trans isomerase, partial [Deltaproteobacteria bacterium]|nr:peptidyl-prolyl cis-trans isomerase [Deltaproteobacteria bacterium]
RRTSEIAASAALCALLLLSACGGGSDETWIAEVNGQQIPISQLRRILEARFELEPDVSREDILNEELSQLVTQQVILNRAHELGIEVTQREADTRLRKLHGNDFSGIDSEFLNEIRKQMLLERTELEDLADRIRFPESALVLYFEENRRRYRTPERVRIRQIVVEDEAKARQLRAQLGEGADFATLAAEHSLAPEAGEGGLLPAFARGEMPEVFDEAFKLRPGGLSRVLESPYGFHLLRSETRIPAHDPELTEVRDAVRMELQQKRLAELRRGWLRGLRRNANIRVNERLLETLL